MNDTVNSTALAEAADWLARLHARPDPDWNDPGLQEWLARDGDHALALATVAGDWHAAAELAGPSVVPLRRPAPARLGPLWALAASVVLAALTWLYWPVVESGWGVLSHDLVALPGSTLERELPDGSRLWLLPGSRADLSFDAKSRRLVLDRGEAVVQVVRDPLRPFTLDFEGGTVTVLGTRFGVAVARQGTSVGVLQGRVNVSGRSGGDQVLGAGMAARVENGQVRGGGPDPEHRFGWHRGRLVLDQVTLSAALERLQGFAGRRLLLLEPAAASTRVSAVIDIDRIDAGVESIAGQAGFRITRLPGATLIHP